MTEKELRSRFIKARRAVIAQDFPALNSAQLQAVMATEGPLLLLAGAGSGKTTVLINRIANLLRYGRASDNDELPAGTGEEDLLFLEAYAKNPSAGDAARAQKLAALEPASPWNVIAITFTNKAADELKSRLGKMLGPQANDVWASTFHSACSRILRSDADKIGISRSFTIYDTADCQALVKRILKDREIDEKMFPPRMLLNYFSSAKDTFISARQFADEADKSGDMRRMKIGEIFLEYDRRLRSADALDFDDLIFYTVKLLSENEEVRRQYQRKFRYVLVDEYQDTNRLQYLLTSLLADGYGNICVVGDDDQSIYRFRGATIENILSFEDEHSKARVIRLEQNYRSTSNILSAANAVIRNNQGRKGKELWTAGEEGETLTIYRAGNETDEAQFIATKMLDGVAEGKRWSDYAILYRMNAQSNTIERTFSQNAIPFKIIGGTRFYERQEIKDIIACLCVIANEADNLRMTRMLTNVVRGVGQRTVDTASRIAQEMELSMLEVMRRSPQLGELKRPAAKLMQTVRMIDDMRAMLESGDVNLADFYDALLEKSGYIAALEEKPEDNAARIENVQELKTNIMRYMEENEEPTLAGFLDEISLYTDLDQYNESSDMAVMMTIHSAKGLEFDTVFVTGVEEGIFPSTRSGMGGPEEIEEERRLCYVALTRAKTKLYITHAHQRMLFGKTSANPVSRFVAELPEENVKHAGYYDSFSQRTPGETPYGGSRVKSYSFDNTAERPKYKKAYSTPPAASAKLADYKTGEVIRHKAFGRGMITAVTPMGGDALLEVAFDEAGTKRLMAKSAAEHITRGQE